MTSTMNFLYPVLLAILALVIQLPERARAEELFSYIYFNCIEDYRHVSLHQITVSTPLGQDTPDFLDFYHLDQEPIAGRSDAAIWVCNVSTFLEYQLFTVHRLPRPEPASQAYCRGRESETLEIRLNGKPLAILTAGCQAHWSTFNLDYYGGELRICQKDADGVVGGHDQCEPTNIRLRIAPKP